MTTESISLTLQGGICQVHRIGGPCYVAHRYPTEKVDGIRTYYGHVQHLRNGWLAMRPGRNAPGRLFRTRAEAKHWLAVPANRVP